MHAYPRHSMVGVECTNARIDRKFRRLSSLRWDLCESPLARMCKNPHLLRTELERIQAEVFAESVLPLREGYWSRAGVKFLHVSRDTSTVTEIHLRGGRSTSLFLHHPVSSGEHLSSKASIVHAAGRSVSSRSGYSSRDPVGCMCGVSSINISLSCSEEGGDKPRVRMVKVLLSDFAPVQPLSCSPWPQPIWGGWRDSLSCCSPDAGPRIMAHQGECRIVRRNGSSSPVPSIPRAGDRTTTRQ